MEQLEIKREIYKLKCYLAKTDYKINKYIEGQLSEEEFAEIKNKRQDARNRINALEQAILTK